MMTSQTSPTSFDDPRIRNAKWRLNNLYFITNKNGEKVRFQMNWAQKILFKQMWFLCVILKARQLGMSTFILIFILDRIVFNSDIRAGVIAHNMDDAKILFRDKIKYAYDNLPEWLRAQRKAIKNDAGELLLSNNSSVRVGTSMRSGTLQYLHISEMGKIASKYPDKAKEIMSGAMNAVKDGCFVFMESTAEGAHGLFNTTYKTAEARVANDEVRTKLSFEPYFFPWYKDPGYVLDTPVVIPERLVRYFKQLAMDFDIHLSDEQQWWYAEKRKTQGSLMGQEYPSYPDEAFDRPIEGAYFTADMLDAAEEERIIDFAVDKLAPVNTFWDIGMDDATCIWFHQRIGLMDYFIDYYSDTDVGVDVYARVLLERGYRYGTHYLPHDGAVREWGNNGQRRHESLAKTGILGDITTVARAQHKLDSIDTARTTFPRCVFHKTMCKDGVAGLRAYRREYDERMEVFKSSPLHDWASNPTDAFFTFSDGYQPVTAHKPLKRRKRTISTM